MLNSYDALLLVSFGGPEGRDEVLPFLENVLRGKQVPQTRIMELAERYYRFDGISPLNQQNRDLIAALGVELAQHGLDLPIYWGNRNGRPLLVDTLQRMAEAGVRRALALATSAYSSYASCRQYREDIQQACKPLGSRAPVVDKIRPFFNHPGLIETFVDRLRTALEHVPPARHATTHLAFTAHSIPMAMADCCDYAEQLAEVRRLVGQGVGAFSSALVYQSRSGPPGQPWLGPDLGDHLRDLRAGGRITDVVLVPIGFMSDHMEVVYDLDCEARQLCETLGLQMVRARTPGTHPRFVAMLRELIFERTHGTAPRAMGRLGPWPHECPPDCCPQSGVGW